MKNLRVKKSIDKLRHISSLYKHAMQSSDTTNHYQLLSDCFASYVAVDMASIVSKKKQSGPLKTQKITEDDEEEEIENNPCSNVVATHLYLKPHSNETLDREVVLRRIRHRKRVHNVKNTVQALLSSPFSSKNDKAAVSAPRVKWVDDAFAAL